MVVDSYRVRPPTSFSPESGTRTHRNQVSICFTQAMFPLFKMHISFEFSRRKFDNRFSPSNSNPDISFTSLFQRQEVTMTASHERYLTAMLESLKDAPSSVDCKGTIKALGKLGNIVAKTLFPVDVLSCFPP